MKTNYFSGQKVMDRAHSYLLVVCKLRPRRAGVQFYPTASMHVTVECVSKGETIKMLLWVPYYPYIYPEIKKDPFFG